MGRTFVGGPIDHETLTFERPARTGVQRWWWVAPPAVLGGIVALALLFSSFAVYPTAPARQAVCATAPNLDAHKVCRQLQSQERRHIHRRRVRADQAGDPSLGGMPSLGSEAEHAMVEARVRQVGAAAVVESHRRFADHAENLALGRAQRGWAAGIGGLGGGLSGLLLVGGVWLRKTRRRVTISAHAITIDDRRILLSQIDRLELEPEVDGFQWLTVVPVDGSPIRARLAVMSGEGERLADLIGRVLPDDDERRAERKNADQVRRHAEALLGRQRD